MLTDIVDSTMLNEILGDVAMARLWTLHDAAARTLMAKCHGQEIARSDGFIVLFETAGDGVEFARAYHRTIGALDPRLKARIGVHVGPVGVHENSISDIMRGAPKFEIYGVALPIAARVMSSAQAEQTLLTAEVIRELGSTSAKIKPCGQWHFKGIAEPMALFVMSDNEAHLDPPPDSGKAYRVVKAPDGWMPARDIAHTLPAERDRFVGRSDALAFLSELLDGATRLVTVLGIGGIGKTRVAQCYARRWLGDYPGGAWFCDLSPARSIDGILQSVAQGLNIALGRSDPVTQIAAAIDGRGPCLIVLDNFEQVARHAEATLGIWLARAPQARFIVTSREVLGVAGEHVLVLAPLSSDESIELFRLRAQAANPRWTPTADDAANIAPLVALLDRLPLAIELAAARSRVMPLTLMLARMHERFEILASRGGRLDRQSTLRATLDWSWDLLADNEKIALAQLSVFRGGFTLDAVEAVVELSMCGDAPHAMDTLQSLVEKSLVHHGEGDRFDLLVSVQEYAAERLLGIAPASLKADAEVRHCNFYTAPHEGERALYAISELDNLIAACRRAAQRRAADDATRALESAWDALKLLGPLNTAIELSAAIRRIGVIDDVAAIRVARVRGSALQAQGQVDQAQAEFEGGLSLAIATENKLREAQFRSFLGDMSANGGQTAEAAEHFRIALALARSLGDREVQCSVLNSLGTLHEYLGELDGAMSHFQEALTIAKACGHRRWEAGALGNLAGLQSLRGNHAEAVPLFENAIAIARALRDRRWEGNALCNLGITYQLLGKFPQAKLELDYALSIARDLGLRRLEAVTLCNIGIVADSMGDLDEARSAYERAIEAARALGDRRSEGQFLTYLGSLDGRSGRHDTARDRLASAEALLESVSDRLSLGLVLSRRVEVEQLAGARETARNMLARAEALAAELNPEPTSEFGVAIERARRLVA